MRSDTSRRGFLNSLGLAAMIRPPMQEKKEPPPPAPPPGVYRNDKIFYDRFGLIIQQEAEGRDPKDFSGTGGDTAQREGMYWFGTWVLANTSGLTPWRGPARRISFETVMQHLEPKPQSEPGRLRRHPTDPAPIVQPDAFSRDQMVSLIAAMAVKGQPNRLKRVVDRIRNNGFLTDNRDDFGKFNPAYLSFIARAQNEQVRVEHDAALIAAGSLGELVWQPIRKLFDLGNRRRAMDDVDRDLNYVVLMTFNTVRNPTIVVQQARELYAKNRPDNYGMYLEAYRRKHGVDWSAHNKDQMIDRMEAILNATPKPEPDCPRVVGAFRWYFRAETGASPGIATMWEPIIRKWFQ